MNIVAVKAHITLDSLTIWRDTVVGQYYIPPMYLWTVFFKIDGDSVSVDLKTLHLQGTAKAVGTPGNHGDVPGVAHGFTLDASDTPYTGKFPIPPGLGDFRTQLKPIAVTSEGKVVIPAVAPGVIGCVAILMSQNGTPDDDVPPGHDALNATLQKALDTLIPTLGMSNQNVSEADIQAIAAQVEKAVHDAIENAMSLGSKVLVLLGDANPDGPWGNLVFQFSGGNADCSPGSSDLVCSPPAGVALNSQIAPWPQQTFTFQGRVIADALPLSLRRILTRLGQTSVKKAMAATTVPYSPRDSVNSWANAVG